MKLFVQEILRLNILAQDYYHSDDDVSTISNSNSDIWRQLKRPILSKFWRTIAQRWQGLKKS